MWLHSLDQGPPNIGENLTELFHHINEFVNVDAIIFINVEFDPKIVFYAFDFIFRISFIHPMIGPEMDGQACPIVVPVRVRVRGFRTCPRPPIPDVVL